MSAPVLFIHSVSNSSFSSQPPKHHYEQTVGAEILSECPSPTQCHMSHATRQVSVVQCHVPGAGVMCQVFFFSHKGLELISGGPFINEAYPV